MSPLVVFDRKLAGCDRAADHNNTGGTLETPQKTLLEKKRNVSSPLRSVGGRSENTKTCNTVCCVRIVLLLYYCCIASTVVISSRAFFFVRGAERCGPRHKQLSRY